MVEAPRKEFEFTFAAVAEGGLQQSQKDSFASTLRGKINANNQLYTVLSSVALGSSEAADELAARLENLSLEEQAKVESE